MSDTIHFTPEKVEQFREAIKQAKEKSEGNPDYTFFFDWHEIRVDYAEYMLAYLEGQMKQ